jgi:hypothetical protein
VLGNWGKGGKASFRAIAKPTTAFGDYSKLGQKPKQKRKK